MVGVYSFLLFIKIIIIFYCSFVEIPDDVGLMESSNRYLVGSYDVRLRAPNLLSTWVDVCKNTHIYI